MKRLFLILALTVSASLSAQEWNLSTNVAGYADFGTLNAEIGYAFARHWNAAASFRYNPFQYESDGEPLQSRQRSFAAGVRYWPWHIYSGWWLAGRARYQEYNRGGIRSPETREGERYGAGMAGGYTYMLTPWLNLEVGLGVWGGLDRYVLYECPVCGLTLEKGRKMFLLPDELLVALSLVF
ncbi:MAG: DUF3575 domain-containing protein [Bacteroidales bacterium]|nr:DUF3575 domain-containing protein [Bacteroidales bacterium]